MPNSHLVPRLLRCTHAIPLIVEVLINAFLLTLCCSIYDSMQPGACSSMLYFHFNLSSGHVIIHLAAACNRIHACNSTRISSSESYDAELSPELGTVQQMHVRSASLQSHPKCTYKYMVDSRPCQFP